MSSKTDDGEIEEWPMFLPVEEPLMRRLQAQYEVEEKQALPHKELGNACYQERKLEEALMHYTRAMHCFSIDSVTRDKMAQGFLLGTAKGCGANSSVQTLGAVAFQLEKRIASYLCSKPHFFQRLPAVICGNISIVLRALKRKGAWEAARRCFMFDPTYIKSLSLLEKAGMDPYSPIEEESRSKFSASLKRSEQIVLLMEEDTSRPVGILATGLLDDPMDFAILEQKRAYEELERVMSSDGYLNFPQDPSPKSVRLSLSLVPFRGRGRTEGQWLIIILAFMDNSRQLRDDVIEIPPYAIPEISHIHFARADLENGADCEKAPNGKASPKSVAFVLDRVPKVARALEERFGIVVKRIRCGQGLVNLTGPHGPQDSMEFGIGPRGLPVTLPPIESRAPAAKEFRETPLGPDSERLWGVWDEFARDMKVLPQHSTYAGERAVELPFFG